MKIYIKLKEHLYLITYQIGGGTTSFENYPDNIISSEGYNVLDNFMLDTNNQIIKDKSWDCIGLTDYKYLYSTNLTGDEEEVILMDNHFLRPTLREPLIRGLYATIARQGQDGFGKEALTALGDIYLNSLSLEEDLKSVAKSCVFSHKGRLKQGIVQIRGLFAK